MSRVALVSMPFNSASGPSLQCGLLAAVLQQKGMEADTLHLNVEFARMMGLRPYERLANVMLPQLGEWMASYALFGDDLPPDDGFLTEFAADVAEQSADSGIDKAGFIRIRHEMFPRFLDWCMENVPWQEYDVVGFSSTFQQQVASLALARRIKEKFPQIQIVIGGSNVLDPMGREHIKAWPWIDHVCLGEGDAALPELVQKLRAGDLGKGVKGMLSRVGDTILDSGPSPAFVDMDALPDPDYDEFFRRYKTLPADQKAEAWGGKTTGLIIETARGCWWGHKHHCTFCGLPGLGMKFRSRSIPKVLAQLERMSKRYNSWLFYAVDNIMDPAYVDGLFGYLGEGGYDYQLMYESKANLTVDKLRTLKNGGLTAIQPGIESFSTAILKIMDKGISGLQNVNTLKWSRYFEIDVIWNVLSGFPGEQQVHYDLQTDWALRLVHLQPPAGQGPIFLQRFSPYFEHSEKYPVKWKKPHGSYKYIYPNDRLDMQKVAYFWDHEMDQTLPFSATEPLLKAINHWKRLWQRKPVPELFYLKGMGRYQVCDTRIPDQPARYDIPGDVGDLLEFCAERPQSFRAICDFVRERKDEGAMTERWVRNALKALLQYGLVLTENDIYLTIALPMHVDRKPYLRRQTRPLAMAES